MTERGWTRSTAHNYLEYELKGDHVTIFDPQYIEENVNTIWSIVKSIKERHQDELAFHEQLSLATSERDKKFDRG